MLRALQALRLDGRQAPRRACDARPWADTSDAPSATRSPRKPTSRIRSRPTNSLVTSRRPVPNERWVTDITYVWTDEGWSYFAAILDLFSRSVVGWAVDATLSTELPLAALDMAIGRRRPGKGLLHHSDRGCQYTSAHYREQLSALDVTVSMSRKGNCWDNAVAESFFATLKNELVHRRSWPNRNDLARGPLRVHRGLLQSPPSALDDRLQDPRPGRERLCSHRRGLTGVNGTGGTPTLRLSPWRLGALAIPTPFSAACYR